MYALFKSKSPLIRILIPVFASLLFINLPPEIITSYSQENNTFVYSFILKGFGTKNFILFYKIVTALFLTLNTIVFSQLIINIKFFKRFDNFHGFIFLMIFSVLIWYTDVLSLLLSMTLFLLALSVLLKTLRKKYALLDIFNAGVLLSFSSWFRFEMLYYFPLILIGLMILRSVNLREWLIVFIGISCPYFIGISLYFFVFSNFNIIFELYDLILYKDVYPNLNFISLITYGLIVFISLISTLKIFSVYRTKETDIQDYLRIFFMIFLISLIYFLLIPNIKYAAISTATIAFTIPLSNFYIFMKRKILREILFDILLIAVLLCQINFFQTIKI